MPSGQARPACPAPLDDPRPPDPSSEGRRQTLKTDRPLPSSFRNRPTRAPLLLAFDASWCGQTRAGGWAVVGQARGGAAWTESGLLGRCADPTAAEARALAEALRLLEEREAAAQAAVLLTDCRALLNLVARAEPRPRIPDSDRLLAAFERRPGIHLAYLHRRCRRMRLVHHLANARRLEAELAAHRPGRRPFHQEPPPC